MEVSQDEASIIFLLSRDGEGVPMKRPQSQQSKFHQNEGPHMWKPQPHPIQACKNKDAEERDNERGSHEGLGLMSHPSMQK